ncbi:Pentatricopeptide repeat-containing protein [Artemisia annua]|uniref:Pentatricopeptide repeat-containing protein n=1 Tax=Artemisia annua TaxID=35608 RepID=A0A2U1MY66_ARTAN|nr:Pentatricopeptide repeat-containing protein [Artemisia annua]
MQATAGLKSDKFTYPFVLKACGRCGMLGYGGSVHSLVLKNGFGANLVVENTLVRMYGACGRVEFARRVFDEMSERDVVSWSSMIAAYLTCKDPLGALSVFLDMKREKEEPNSVTLVSMLSVCSRLVNVKMGECIHSYILTNGIGLDVSLATALVDMYAACGYVDKAKVVFDSMDERNLQTWTIMISGLAENGHGEEAISLLNEMGGFGLVPDAMLFSSILSACSHLGLVEKGQKYFDQMVKIYKTEPRMEHYGCMVDMYGRAGMIEEAYRVIKDMPMEPSSIMLRSFISAYKNHGSRIGFDDDLMKLLLKLEPDLGANYVLSANMSSLSGSWNEVDGTRVAMKGKGLNKVPGCSWVEVKRATAGLKSDKFTYPFVLKACGRCGMLGYGGSVHSLVLKSGFGGNLVVENTLVRMYGACGRVEFARRVFDEMSERDVVSWSSMIAVYLSCKDPLGALLVFLDMKREKEEPNSVTLVSMLSVCSRLVNVKMGECIHSYILTNGIGLDVSLATALVEMYAACGYIDKAKVVFDSMDERNLQTWTIMISGLAENGHGEEAMSLLNEMGGFGLVPDAMLFSSILSACSHLGLVEKGQKYFDQMVKIYKIEPRMEHYGCMVDMYGRAGMIEEAYRVIKDMPMEPSSIMLRSFISAYKNHGSRIGFDDDLMKLLLKLEPDLGANYVLSANMSSLSGSWNEVDGTRVAMKGKGLNKVPGCSWVEVKRVHNKDNICE